MATDVAVLNSSTVGGLQVYKPPSVPKRVNVLLYGDSGVGKTHLLGLADAVPAMRPVLVIDVEGGESTLKNSAPEIDIVRVKSWVEVQRIYNDLYAGKHNYNSVGIDSLTEAQIMGMSRLLEREWSDYDMLDEKVPEIKQWLINTEQVKRCVRAFKDLPMNTIFTALAGADEKGKIFPQFSKDLRKSVPALCETVLYMYRKSVNKDGKVELKRLITSQGSDKVIAKSRPTMPSVLEDPTMAKIYGIITSEEK